MQRVTDGAKLAACALGVGFFIVGGSVSKRHLYLIPLFPWLALWIGWYVERALLVSDERKSPAWVAPVFQLLAALSLGCAAWSVYWLPSAGAITGEIAFAAFLGVCIAVAFFITARDISITKLQTGDRLLSSLIAAAAMTLVVEGVVSSHSRARAESHCILRRNTCRN